MMVNILASIFDNFGENLTWGGFTILLGVTVVFLGMTVLVLAVSAIGKVISTVNKKANKQTEKTPKTEEKKEVQSQDEDVPEHVRVAIIAAISAFYMESGSKNEFTVRKIKKL